MTDLFDNLSLSVCLLLLLFALVTLSVAQDSPPNVLLIVTDDKY